MQGDVPQRRHKETPDLSQELRKKIDLTRDTCKVHYNLAHLLVARERSSRLREQLVELNGIEPSAS